MVQLEQRNQTVQRVVEDLVKSPGDGLSGDVEDPESDADLRLLNLDHVEGLVGKHRHPDERDGKVHGFQHTQQAPVSYECSTVGLG